MEIKSEKKRKKKFW